MRRGAFIEGVHRYHLWRAWVPGARSLTWVMLNPSTADGDVDDPTVRKCIGFARQWGFGSIDVVNAYSYRTRSPKELRASGYPNGTHADAAIRGVLRRYTDRVVYAWGTKALGDRVAQVDALVRAEGFEPWTLGLTQGGHPQHPLYVPYETELTRFMGAYDAA